MSRAEEVSGAWDRMYTTPGKFDDAMAGVATDAAGNVFVLGSTKLETKTSDVYLAKYAASNGAVLWQKRYDGPARKSDYASGLVVDGAGDVYFSASLVMKGGKQGLYVSKRSGATGAVIWEAFPGQDHPFLQVAGGLKIAPDGNLIFGSQVYVGAPQAPHFVAWKLEADSGEVMWRGAFAPDAKYSSSLLTDLVITAAGDVVMAGYGRQAVAAPDSALVAKLSGVDGVPKWSAEGVSASQFNGFPIKVAANAEGDVFVVYSRDQAGVDLTHDIVAAKYDGSFGTLSWEVVVDGSESLDDVGRDIGVLSDGRVVVSGSVGKSVTPIASDPYTQKDYYTACLSGETGVEQWSKLYSGLYETDDTPRVLLVDSADDVIVAGESLVEPHAVKYDSETGEQIWSAGEFPKILRGVTHACLDTGGNVILGATHLVAKGPIRTWHDNIFTGKLATTGAVPIVTNDFADGATATGATLRAQVGAAGSSTSVVFEYGLTASLGSQITAIPANVTGSAATPVSAVLTGLTPSTSYFFRVKATNSVGTTTGQVRAFSTSASAGLPIVSFASVTVQAAEGNSGSSMATLNVQLSTSPASPVSVSYASSDVTATAGSDYTAASGTVNFGVGETSKGIQIPITGDTNDEGSGETFEVQLSAPSGATLGSPSVATVTIVDDDEAGPTVTAPMAATQPAVSVTSTGATLRGVVTANGADTTVFFDYGLDGSFGNTVAGVPSIVSGQTAVQVTANLPSAFAPATTYFFRVRGTNSEGTSNGGTVQFITLGSGQGNLPPVAVDDVAFVEPNESVTVSVLANDSDPNPGDVLRIVSVTAGTGTALISPDLKKISYLAGSDFTTDTITYEVSDGQATSSAKLNLGSFRSVAGQYTGRVTTGSLDVNENGVLDLAVLATGSYSGTLRWQGESYPLKGRIGLDGAVTLIVAKKGETGTLQLDLVIDPLTGVVSGAFLDVSGGMTLTASVELNRVDTGEGGRAPASALFTSFIDVQGGAGPASARDAATSGAVEPVSVRGIGYAVLTMSRKNAAARILARMPDGEFFTAGRPFAGGKYALTEPLYKGSGGNFRGLVRGDVVFRRNGSSVDSERLDAQLQWSRGSEVSSTYFPRGIQASTALNARPFNAKRSGVLPIAVGAGASSNVAIEIDGGDLTSLVTRTGFASGKGKVKLNADDIDFKFKKNKDGSFKGSFKHPGLGRVVTFEGAFDQFVEEGRGVFAGSTESGRFSLRAYNPQ